VRLRWVLLVGLGFFAVSLGTVRRREEFNERLKDASDTLVNGTLRATSQFGSELTDERQREQEAFRRLRLRDLR